jgi:hypothetical protein
MGELQAFQFFCYAKPYLIAVARLSRPFDVNLPVSSVQNHHAWPK